MSTDAILVYVTCPPDKAETLAQALVEARVAACVNILPAVTSVYRWKDQVQRDGEALLLIKTAESRFAQLKATVLSNHPYELPEVIAVKLAQGHAPYLQWILDCTT